MTRHQRHSGSAAMALLATTVLAAPSLASASAGPYPGDLGQAIAALLIFLGLATVLSKYAWRPVIDQLRRRDEDIAKRLTDADTKQAQADEAQAELSRQLENIDVQAEQVLGQARREAAAESTRILDTARDQAREVVARAEKDIAQAKAQARQDIQAATAKVAGEIAGQFLQEKLSADDHNRLVAQAAEQMDKGEEGEQ
ncbi:MAG: hypothetical protein DRP83_01070 [Planctomycetota bacterium]|nr:MAG: hypothetical protein DRP83_01070 [Planctomycetota bacterium]